MTMRQLNRVSGNKYAAYQLKPSFDVCIVNLTHKPSEKILFLRFDFLKWF